MALHVVRATPERLRSLPTRVRPRVDPADVRVPSGYHLEPIIAGLSFPTALCFGEEGELYVAEGGSPGPARPAGVPRILRLDPVGRLDPFVSLDLTGVRGMVVHRGQLYLTARVGERTALQRLDLRTRARTVLYQALSPAAPAEPGAPAVGPHDGLVYFTRGAPPGRGPRTTTLWRLTPDGGRPQAIATGFPGPLGLAFDDSGELYASEDDHPDAVPGTARRLWLVKTARLPPGTVQQPAAAEPLVTLPALGRLDVCPSDAFGTGHARKIFACMPDGAPSPAASASGPGVAEIDPQSRSVVPFLANERPGPASAYPRAGGLERPVDCKFSPDERSLYVLDFGVSTAGPAPAAYAHTGVLWRLTRR